MRIFWKFDCRRNCGHGGPRDGSRDGSGEPTAYRRCTPPGFLVSRLAASAGMTANFCPGRSPRASFPFQRGHLLRHHDQDAQPLGSFRDFPKPDTRIGQAWRLPNGQPVGTGGFGHVLHAVGQDDGGEEERPAVVAVNPGELVEVFEHRGSPSCEGCVKPTLDHEETGTEILSRAIGLKTAEARPRKRESPPTTSGLPLNLGSS